MFLLKLTERSDIIETLMQNNQPLLSFSFLYIIRRFWYRIAIFFHHWYIDGSYLFAHKWFEVFSGLERSFALKITLAHFFEPLYQDYSVVGQIIGPIFRLGRIFVGGVICVIFGSFFLLAYLLWLAIPVILLLQAFLSFLSRP